MQDEKSAEGKPVSEDPLVTLNRVMGIDSGRDLHNRFGLIFMRMVGFETDEEVTRFLTDNAQDLRALSAECESTPIYKHSAERLAEFKESFETQTPEPKRLLASWCWLLDRLHNAPTAVHRYNAVILCLPGFVRYLPVAPTEAKH